MAASYISVPRDLTKVKSKVMFNLTKRQLICFGPVSYTHLIRYWVRKATPGTEESKEPPKKQPVKEVLQDKADEKKTEKTAPEQTKHKQQNMEL